MNDDKELRLKAGRRKITKMYGLRMMIRRLRDGWGFAITPDGRGCTYDQRQTHGCAIGCLMPDNRLADVDVSFPALPGNVHAMFEGFDDKGNGVEIESIVFWSRLQQWHDLLACGDKLADEPMLACIEQLD